jgi:hypothetical protein
VERIVVLTRGNEIGLADLPEFLQAESVPVDIDLPSKGISLINIEKELLLRALRNCNWNQSRAARHLGLSRKTLIYRMQKYGLGENKLLYPTSSATFGEHIESTSDPRFQSGQPMGGHYDTRREAPNRHDQRKFDVQNAVSG